jgi:hypothetical protein
MEMKEDPTMSELLARIKKLESKSEKSERNNWRGLFLSIVYLILLFGLAATFLQRFFELINELYPSHVVGVAMENRLPGYLRFLIPVNNRLDTKLGVSILLVLTSIAFIYEFVNTIYKIRVFFKHGGQLAEG